jgi:hypothetical protein
LGDKDDTLMHILAVKCPVKRRIHEPIPSAYFPVYDGPDFPRPRIRRVLPPLVADFIRDADTTQILHRLTHHTAGDKMNKTCRENDKLFMFPHDRDPVA